MWAIVIVVAWVVWSPNGANYEREVGRHSREVVLRFDSLEACQAKGAALAKTSRHERVRLRPETQYTPNSPDRRRGAEALVSVSDCRLAQPTS